MFWKYGNPESGWDLDKEGELAVPASSAVAGSSALKGAFEKQAASGNGESPDEPGFYRCLVSVLT